MSGLFQQKQKELLLGVARVEQLCQQLEALRSREANSAGPSSSPAAELERLCGELRLRNRLNLEQKWRLQQQRDALKRKNQEVANTERRVAQLRQRLCKKKAGLQHKDSTPMPSDSTIPQHVASKIAAVGPYIQWSCQGPPLPPHQEIVPRPACSNATASLPAMHELASLKLPASAVNKVSDWSRSNGSPSRASTLPRMANLRRYTPESDACKTAVSPPVPLHPLREGCKCDWPNHTTKKLPSDQKDPGTSSPKALRGPPPSYGTGTFPRRKRASGVALHSRTLPLPSKQETPPAAAVRPYTPEPWDPLAPQKPQRVAASSIYSMYTQQSTLVQTYQSGTLPRCQTRAYGKPVCEGQRSNSWAITSGSSSWKRADVDSGFQPGGDICGAEPAAEPATPRPLSPTKLLPFMTNIHRNHADVDLEALRRRHHAPRPLKKRSSITEPEGPAGPNIQKLLYQKTTLAAMETIPMEIQEPISEHVGTSDASGKTLESPGDNGTPLPVPPCSPIPGAISCHIPMSNQDAEEETALPSYPVERDAALNLRTPEVTGQVLGKKSILRTSASVPVDRTVRVKFNPEAILLDASLEGEYELVQRVVYKVDNPSGSNDEGITALHNAVCAGHGDIVRFLVHFGVDVNAADSDGWTPLHCAASCNNVELCKFLVESGAAVLTATLSDGQTAADKCEETDNGYAQCSHFLYGIQEKMGVMNRGAVYGLWDYEAQSRDELAFRTGDCLTVLRRDEEADGDWWLACCGDRRGFVPRNLLGLYPRVRPQHRSLA